MEASLNEPGEAPRFARLQRVKLRCDDEHGTRVASLPAVVLGRDADGTYRVGAIDTLDAESPACRVVTGVVESRLQEAFRYELGARLRVQLADGQHAYGIVVAAFPPRALAAEEAAAGEGAETPATPGAVSIPATPAVGSGAGAAEVGGGAGCALAEDGFLVGCTYDVRLSAGAEDSAGPAARRAKGALEEGVPEARLFKVKSCVTDALVLVEFPPPPPEAPQEAAQARPPGSPPGSPSTVRFAGDGVADAAAAEADAAGRRCWAVVVEEESLGFYKVRRTVDGEVMEGIDSMWMSEVEPYVVGERVKVQITEGMFRGFVTAESSTGVYTVRRNMDGEEVEFCDGCTMEHLLEADEMTETAERVAAELALVAADVRHRAEEDDLLPTLGIRGEERRAFLRRQVDATTAAAERTAADCAELAERLVEAEFLADEAARAVAPPPPRGGQPAAADGAVAPAAPEEVPFELMTSEEQEEYLRRQEELEEKKQEEARLAAEVKLARRFARRAAKASAAASEAATAVRAAAEAVEAEAKSRRDAAKRKAALWGKATKEKAACAVIWLHGQGESEVSWQTTLADVAVPSSFGLVRWIWPRAPLQPCSTRGGVLTPQWFDTPEFPKTKVVRGVPDRPTRDEDPKDVCKATHRIHAVIEALEAEGMPSERIALAGFGQGAALVPHAVMRFQRPLAGGALFCGWVPCREALAVAAELSAPPGGRPSPPEFLWCHGARDAVVDPRYAAEQAAWLKAAGAKVDFRMYPELTFGVNHELVAALEGWLFERLRPEGWSPPSPLPEGEEAADGNVGEEGEGDFVRTERLPADVAIPMEAKA